MSTDLIMTKLLMLPGIIMALSFHEFAHAWVSDKLGILRREDREG